MKNLVYIGNKLANKGKTVTTLETLSIRLKKEGYNVITTSNKSNKILRLLDMLSTIFRNRKIVDYVLIDTYSTQNFYYALFCAILCKKLKLKYIPILHGGNLPNRLNNSKRKSDIIFKNAYKNIAPSLYTKSIFETHGYSNLMMIPNTIEIEKYEFKKRDYANINLLWVRSFSKIYNPLMAIRVAKLLEDKGQKNNLCMIGPDKDGSLAHAKKLVKRLNINVEFTGKLDTEKWIDKSNDFNIFINTTNFDNMPLSVIEAMALGLPIISTNVGGVPFLISNDHEGILIPKNDVDSMADAILKIKNNPDLGNNLAAEARKKAETFSWQKNKILWTNLLK